MAGTPKPIGRILIIPKGNYDPATPYNSLDLVRYDFKSWLCKTDGIIGITPTEGTDWTLMTEDGTDGTDGRGIVNIQRTGTDPSNPLKDIYTITYTDGTTSTFTVTNGSGGGTTADTMLKSVYDKDDDGIVDKADAANTATNATDATNAKNLKKSDGTTISADSINTKLSNVDNKIDKPASATEGQVLTYRNNKWVADDSQGGGGGQFVIIAKGEIYEGQTVTATKGTKSKSAVITDGIARIMVDEGGVWTLTLTDGSTYKTPNMTYYGEYEVALAPNGSTVTPTDDIQTWLHCANIFDKQYTTVSQVVADKTTLNALVQNENANDYLVRSTTFSTKLCENNTNNEAMYYLGLYDSCADKLLADEHWRNAICSADVLLADGQTYLFEKVLKVKVPTMISNTSPSGVCRDNEGSSKTYLAFDNKDSTQLELINQVGSYFQYMFTKPVRVNKVRMYNIGNEEYCVQASKDGSNWVNLYDGIRKVNMEQKLNIPNNEYYKYYRLYQTKKLSGNTYSWVNTFQFYGREEA